MKENIARKPELEINISLKKLFRFEQMRCLTINACAFFIWEEAISQQWDINSLVLLILIYHI